MRRLRVRLRLGIVSAEYYKEQFAKLKTDFRLKKRPWGLPLILWVLLLIGLVVAGAVTLVVLSNMLRTQTTINPTSSVTPISLTWNSELPPNMVRGVRAYAQFRLVNTGSNEYNNAVLFANVTTSTVSIGDTSVLTINVSPSSQLWSGQTINLVVGAVGGGLLGQTGPTTITSNQIAIVDISVLFNNNAFSTTYTLQFWVQQ